MRRLFAATILALAAVSGIQRADAKTIGVSLASDTNPLYIAMLKGIRDRAASLGYQISVVSAEEDVAKQLDGLNDLVAKKVDGILVSPIDAKALCSAYDRAKAANIPIMSIARGSDCASQTLHISTDEIRIGREIAEWTGQKLGGKGKIAMLAGPAGAQAFMNFSKGYEEGIAKFPNVKVVFKHQMLLTRENGLKYTEDALVAHPDLNAIYGANDEIGMGAGQAVTAAGKKGSVIVTGMNGIPPALRAVKNGAMDLTVVLNPLEWGKLGADTMDALLKGKKFESKVYINHVLVDKGNVDKFVPTN